MTDYLFHGDTQRSAAMRHELPVSIGDPFLLAVVDGRLHVMVSNLEHERVAAAVPDAVLHDIADLGSFELLESGMNFAELDLELVSRAAAAAGVHEAIVGPELPVIVADRLRADGIVLHPDPARSPRGAGASRRRSWPASAARKTRRTPACAPRPNCCASRRPTATASCVRVRS